jgi:hypothetical protein
MNYQFLILTLLHSSSLLAQTKCIKGDCKNGFGILEENHIRYEGEFKDGRFNGQGTMIFLDSSKWAGDKYIGEFKNDYRNGKGRYEYSHGSVFEGSYLKNKENGFGTYTWPNGHKYSGEFKNGYRQGLGTYFYSDGEWSKGYWDKDELHGTAYYYFDSSACYYGNWIRGIRTGKGVFLDTGLVYTGELKNNVFNGYGEITFLGTNEFTGNYYVGGFKNDFFDGEGIYTDKNGNIEMGIWANGEFVSALELELKRPQYEKNHTVVEMIDNHKCPNNPDKVFFE